MVESITISKTSSYVGYYADIEGDGTVDGVIYADLAFSVSGQWNHNFGEFSYEAITETKDYYVSQENYEGDFGTKDVLTATGSGNDRFYVMALDDYTTSDNSTFYWYYKSSDEETLSSSSGTGTDFGDGKVSTGNMIRNWNNNMPFRANIGLLVHLGI